MNDIHKRILKIKRFRLNSRRTEIREILNWIHDYELSKELIRIQIEVREINKKLNYEDD